ncbi:putative transporter C405.03c-like protein [Gossypium australe]|uniref:Putative transporter C405.03c-like protein n=1 Tax=Gossypium australe TaxID=47621 RepID=A0A5B6VGX4_9ROSI|nr:putative transporter C405.03c-like protein [Gossypium australe]
MWVTSAEVTQGVFEDYKHPFVVSYVGTSLLTLYLPLAFFKDFLLKLLRGLQGPQNPSVEHDDKHRINLKTLPDHVIEEGNDVMGSRKNDGMLSAMQVVAFGFCMAPIWFATEYLTNAALARTSVANTTLLSSTSGLFTLIFGAILGQDSINAVNVVSVIISITGVAMTAFGDTWRPLNESKPITNNKMELFSRVTGVEDREEMMELGVSENHVIVGNLLEMLSAMIYGLFSAWPLTAIGIEPKLTFPRSTNLQEIIIINSFIGNFLSDYFWALGVVWTSPLVASLGVSLTIPIAVLEDMIIHGRQYSMIYMIGAAQEKSWKCRPPSSQPGPSTIENIISLLGFCPKPLRRAM